MRDHTCIRIDRVAAFLMTINPDRVRAAGNTSGADSRASKVAMAEGEMARAGFSTFSP